MHHAAKLSIAVRKDLGMPLVLETATVEVPVKPLGKLPDNGLSVDAFHDLLR